MNVYRKNTRAIRFYQREGFEILNEGLDEAVGEKDCAMLWRSKKSPDLKNANRTLQSVKTGFYVMYAFL